MWRETIHYMAVGIGSMVTLLAPQAVILGADSGLDGALALAALALPSSLNE